MVRTLGLQLFTAGVAVGVPNFVIIFADDMGYGDTSFTGNPMIHTPNLDKMAVEGMRFTQWYSANPVCSPSRAAMLTGRLPPRSGLAGGWQGGVFTNNAVGGMPANETTFAEVLGAEGYASLMLGKWHLGQREQFLPTNHGFEEYFGVPYSVDMARSAWRDASFGTDVPLPLYHNTTIVEQPADLNTLDSRYTAMAVDFIQRNAAAEKPFVLYYACNHVHTPNYASQDFCNTSKRGRYGDAMAEMDASIGKVMAGLKTAGVDEDTIVFFTSDNGPWITQFKNGGSAGPFFEGKASTWEGGIRMPAIVRWPGKIPAGSLSMELATTPDIFTTAIALAEAELPADRVIDGKDLSGVLFRGEASPHECLFHYKGSPSSGLPPAEDDPEPGLWAIRCGPYKAHFVTVCTLMQDFGDSRCSNTAGRAEHFTQGGGPDYEKGSAPLSHSPPLMYNVEHDLSEQYPMDPNSDEYAKALATIMRAKREHEATLSPVPNQMALGGEDDYVSCCDPASQEKFPKYPNCTCNPENFGHEWGSDNFVCAPVYESKTHSGPAVSAVKLAV